MINYKAFLTYLDVFLIYSDIDLFLSGLKNGRWVIVQKYK